MSSAQHHHNIITTSSQHHHNIITTSSLHHHNIITTTAITTTAITTTAITTPWWFRFGRPFGLATSDVERHLKLFYIVLESLTLVPA